jgi:hypothetical protein
MFKRYLLAFAGVCLLVAAGCNTQAGDEGVRNVLATACPSANQAYAYYAAVASSGAISQRTMNRVEQAKAGIDALCTNRESATIVSVLAAGALVYVTTKDAIREARANGASVGYAGDLRKLDGMMAKLKKGLDHAR